MGSHGHRALSGVNVPVFYAELMKNQDFSLLSWFMKGRILASFPNITVKKQPGNYGFQLNRVGLKDSYSPSSMMCRVYPAQVTYTNPVFLSTARARASVFLLAGLSTLWNVVDRKLVSICVKQNNIFVCHWLQFLVVHWNSCTGTALPSHRDFSVNEQHFRCNADSKSCYHPLAEKQNTHNDF